MLPSSAVCLSARRVKQPYCTMPTPPVRAHELPDYAYRDFHGVVDDIVLADRVHAVDGQPVIAVDACWEDHGRFERIALLARQAMVVAGRVHVETTAYQVVDICPCEYELE